MSDFSVAESISRPINLQCPACGRIFNNSRVKKAHQRAEGHFQCAVCKAKFHDDAAVVHHVFEEHKTVHEIKCPGCLKIFMRAGAWLQHVENYECTGIFPEDLEARKKKTEDFQEALAKLEPSGPDWLEGVDVSAATDTWRDDPIVATLGGHDNLKPHHGTTVDQNYTKPVDFPRLGTHEYRAGGSKQPDLLTGDAPGLQPMQPANAWAQKKNLFPDAKSDKPLSAAQTPLGNGPPQSSAFAGPAAYRRGPAPMQDRNASIQVVKSYNAVPPTPDLLAFATCGVRDSDQFRRKLSELSGGLLDTKPMGAEEDRANPEGMTRDMANIFIDEKAIVELRKPSSGQVPGLEGKKEAQQQADQRSRGW
ncbi:hypothetical protein DL771_007136 [Monosporascus sp. 5C6A]|nr:hypothetical protein DL771_007136 [Monosporascus sp. 5C6A]